MIGHVAEIWSFTNLYRLGYAGPTARYSRLQRYGRELGRSSSKVASLLLQLLTLVTVG